MKHTLESCPFCGEAVVLKPSKRGEYTSIVCEGEAACSGPLMAIIPNDRIADGVAAWNRRAPSLASPVRDGQ